MTRHISPFLQCLPQAFGKPVARLGLASRGESALAPDDVLHAVDCGVRFMNWHGMADSGVAVPDGMSHAIASLGSRREDIVVSVQFGARTARKARHEWKALLSALRTDYIDVLTLYYVEQRDEWDLLARPGGVLAFCRAAQADGAIRRLGVTGHQRPLLTELTGSGELDVIMLRYNAAHRGVENTVFPIAMEYGIPVISYTATRWSALLESTPDDPPSFDVPRAPCWYRFVLQHPAVSVVLSAPCNRRQLDEDLTVLDSVGPLPDQEYKRLVEHGARVRRHAGHFD